MMTELHLHPSISRARLREALVRSENALFALLFGHPANGMNQAAATVRRIIDEIDRQETMSEFPLGIDPVPGDTRPECEARVNIRGADFKCDLTQEHDGWAHSNKEAGAIW
jgi:hypothetical protein